IKKTIESADRFISSTPFPAKAIELLDEACVYLTTGKCHPELVSGSASKSLGMPKLVQHDRKLLTASDIDEFLSDKMHMAIGNLQKEEGEKLVNLENLLHQRVINQEVAIHAISSSLRRSRLEVSAINKPVGSFLFLGPTGVGKTETAKALSAIYFGGEETCLRFDMSQYQKEEGLERLIGSIKLGTPGELIGKLTEHPFSLLLLDEFEKADKEIYNLFLTLLDEGYVTGSIGKKVNAKNTIIIATSNAGGEFIREQIQQGLQGVALQEALLEHIQREKIFSPELLNRFDSVVVFSPLTEGQLREVARLMLEDLNRRLTPKEISVDINQDLIRKIAVLGFDPQWGARAMKRVIAEKIEDQVAQKLLSGNVKKGEVIQIQL
ncbi:ATP-dependent Clp protease ATP-binding subunit, partial [Candidatus Gottesmanbacteria bacterium]|nr:ATP-dependent Clp protease ATP-binding subunit [Candidatus Gottesmanbacteria bacterium]